VELCDLNNAVAVDAAAADMTAPLRVTAHTETRKLSSCKPFVVYGRPKSKHSKASSLEWIFIDFNIKHFASSIFYFGRNN